MTDSPKRRKCSHTNTTNTTNLNTTPKSVDSLPRTSSLTKQVGSNEQYWMYTTDDYHLYNLSPISVFENTNNNANTEGDDSGKCSKS